MPRVYVRSDDFAYGVFSFEPGKPKGAAEREPGDLRAVASFAADMHRVAPSARVRVRMSITKQPISERACLARPWQATASSLKPIE